MAEKPEISMLKETKPTGLEERILVCMADRKDARGVISALEQSGFGAEPCFDLPSFGEKVAEGAGAAFLSDEILRNGNLPLLTQCLGEQPAWSDLPLIMAARSGDELKESLQAFGTLNSGGNIMLIDRPIRDVNLRNAVQVALRARRRQYDVRDLIEQREAILGSISDPFMMLDRDFRFVYINDRAASVRGRSPEELLGRVKWDIFPEIVGSPYYNALLDAMEKDTIGRLEYYDPIADRWYEKRIYPSRVGVSVFGSDVTERKQAEEALRQSEEKFRLIVESAVEYAIFSVDCSCVITSWNAGAERLLGYSEQEIIGQPLNVIFTPEDRRRKVPDQEMDRSTTERKAEDERWHVRKDGSRFWASGQVMPMVDRDGEIRGFVKILRDYTGRKRAETWLRALNESLEKRVEERTAEAEQRASQLQMLAAELTQAEERERRRLAELLHDHLQQILVAAKMQVGILNQQSPEASIAEGLQRVDNLLERSIDASRSLTVELSPPILYDAGLGAALHWLARRMFKDHNLQILVDAEEEAEPESDNARAFLFQTVRELLFNIVKHSGVNEAEVHLRRSGGEVEVSVSDNGSGFDPALSSSARGDGAGFGLFSIGERVRLLGGSVEIDTAPGRGTKVCVRVLPSEPEIAISRNGRSKKLPATVRRKEAEVALEPPAQPGRIRILLADDHKILREGLAGLLRGQAGFEVVSEASDGQMAVEMARETRPDIIVMDISMPRLNGVEATRIITQEMPGIKVIGLSMHAREDMADAMRKAGATGFVTKGAPSEVLTAAIRDAAVHESRGV